LKNSLLSQTTDDTMMTRLLLLVLLGATGLSAVSAFSSSSTFVPKTAASLTSSSSSSTLLRMNIESVKTKDNVRVGVIGMGRIGLVHLEAITKAPGVQAVIVSNPTISKAEAGEHYIDMFNISLFCEILCILSA
jgi:lactate dehydrogenase-like 2-hydroxyacid dehydrogenase